MQQEHSPLPWKVVQEPEYGSRTRVITTDKSSVASTEQPCYVAIPNGKTQVANAQFIVQACNAYEDLLVACKYCLEYFERYQQGTGLNMKKETTMLKTAITKAGAKGGDAQA